MLELSKREVEVAKLVCTGHSDPGIAAALGVTVSTVGVHLSNMYAKLRVSGDLRAGQNQRCSLMAAMYRYGYVTGSKQMNLLDGVGSIQV